MHVQPIVSRPARVWAAIVGGLAVGLVVWRLGLASYTRWALGEIVLYSTARQTSILVVLVSLIFGTMGVYFLARWAGDPSSAAKTEMPGRDNRGRAGF
jgi:predicted lipid-binding transport protein (Tim44 family)